MVKLVATELSRQLATDQIFNNKNQIHLLVLYWCIRITVTRQRSSLIKNTDGNISTFTQIVQSLNYDLEFSFWGE